MRCPETARVAARSWAIGFAIVGHADEWDIYQTDEVAAWLRELQDSDLKTADLVDDAIYTLSVSGPALGRPLVDTITNSKIANLKELRPGSRGRSEVRILFVLPMALGDPACRRGQGRELEQVVCADDPQGRAAV